MAGIPTSNILQPGNIAIVGGATRALVSQLQLLTPQFYKKYTEKYGNEDFTWWLATYGGMEQVKNRDFFWFENRGKLMEAVTVSTAVASTAGATITVTLASGDHYNSGTQSPLRVGETVRVASTNVEGEILTVSTAVPSAHTFTIRPKQTTQTFRSFGDASNLAAGEVLIFGGIMDVGEASNSNTPLVHLDQRYANTTTEMRDTWTATDLAEMTEVYYNSGVSGDGPTGASQAGTSYFTLKGLIKANMRFKNSVESKLMRGDIVNNTGLNSTTSVGTQGFLPKVAADGETIGYSAPTLDIQKLHEITRVMDVNGCATENLWLMDIYQRQNFSDGIFKEFPAGAWAWGTNENSEDAAINYGVQSILIDGYLLKAKKYRPFNTEFTTGKTPTVDNYRNYGVICPQGVAKNSKDGNSNPIKNLSIMYQNPVGGGTTGNGIRVWNHGGGSTAATNGQLIDNVEMVTYRGIRVAGANQFIQVVAQ